MKQHGTNLVSYQNNQFKYSDSNMIGKDQKKIGILFIFGFKYGPFKYGPFKYCTTRTLLKILAIIQMQDALRARFRFSLLASTSTYLAAPLPCIISGFFARNH